MNREKYLFTYRKVLIMLFMDYSQETIKRNMGKRQKFLGSLEKLLEQDNKIKLSHILLTHLSKYVEFALKKFVY
jgi:hypothetical protein